METDTSQTKSKAKSKAKAKTSAKSKSTAKSSTSATKSKTALKTLPPITTLGQTKSLAMLYHYAAKKYGHVKGYNTKIKEGRKHHWEGVSYAQMLEYGKQLGVALIDLGLEPKEHVGAIADNRTEWAIQDCAVQLNGAVNVPRGSDATEGDIEYILAHAECRFCFAEDATQLKKIQNLKDKLPVEKIIVLDKKFDKADNKTTFSLWELVEKGKGLMDKYGAELEHRSASIEKDDLFTIIYTSGTTGPPKGVMLSHGNIMFQVQELPKFSEIDEGERFLSILPVWHIFERFLEYVGMGQGGLMYYTNVRDMKEDIAEIKPTFMGSAPRLWEKVYDGIQQRLKDVSPLQKTVFDIAFEVNKLYKRGRAYLEGNELQIHEDDERTKLVKTAGALAATIGLHLPAQLLDDVVFKKLRDAMGGQLKATVSGGGALPSYVDEFFNTIGLNVLEGYGMTETAPIISCRTKDRMVLGSVGPIFVNTEVKLLDDQGKEVPQGEKGVIHVRGPQVMKGYYKRPEETAKVLKDGWLNTGDIGVMTAVGTLKITGRAKDTVVLLGGENVEPVPIENKLLESDLIDQAVVVGQDHKTLSALIYPNFAKLGITIEQYESVDHESAHKTEYGKRIMAEIKLQVSAGSGFKSFERVTDFRFLPKPLEVGEELTNLFKMKRNVITDKYEKLIKSMA